MSEIANPVVYMVGGLPRTGKSILSQRIKSHVGCGGFETDHMRALFSADLHSAVGFDSGAEIALVAKQAAPYIHKLMEFVIGSGHDFLIEGELVTPKLVIKSPHRAHIRSHFLGISDPDLAFDNIRNNSSPNDWAAKVSDEQLAAILEKYVARSTKIGRLCTKYGLDYTDVTQNFVEAHEAAFAKITSQPEGIIIARAESLHNV